MRKKTQILLPFLFAVLLSALPSRHAQAQLQIQDDHIAEQLAQHLAGRGVRVFNVTSTGRANMSGIFLNRNTNLALDSGIVLTNGLSKSARGPVIGADNTQLSQASNDRGQPGDADIDRLLQDAGAPASIRSRDAFVLEFDFIPTGDTVSFRYVFGSEEYPQYNCTQFNDIFLFYISGPGITGKKNMAVVPGTNIPVAINSINNGITNPPHQIATCAALGAGSPFTQFYIDNFGAQSVSYNGLTTPLRAFYPVRPCFQYHLKLVIADIADGVFDSGVFLEAGSLSSDYATLSYSGPTENGLPYLSEGCDTAMITVRLSKPGASARTILLPTGGPTENNTEMAPFVPSQYVLPAGETTFSFPLSAVQDNLSDDNEYLVIYVSPKSCGDPIITDSLKIYIGDYKRITVQPDITSVCLGSSVQLAVTTPGISNYNWTPAAGLSSTNIFNPIAQPDTTTLYTVTGNLTSSCKTKGTSLVRMKDSTLLTISKRDISCFGHDGSITITLDGSWVNPAYSINGSAFGSSNTFTNLDPGWYVVAVRDATGCEAKKTVLLVVLDALTATFTTSAANCFGFSGRIFVSARGGQRPYEYSLNGLNYHTDSAIIVFAPGNHTLYVRDAFGCVFTAPFNIGRDVPILFSTAVTTDSCRGRADGTVTITANGGSGIYAYSWNGTDFQPNNVLNVPAGSYTITVRDDKECISTQSAVVPLNNTLVIDAGLDSTICEGKSVQLQSTGNAFSYSWSPATGLNRADTLHPVASPTVTTRYKLTATAGLCAREDSLTITVNRAPVANAGPDTTICFGARAQLHGSGGTVYQWAPVQNISNRNIPNPEAYPRSTTSFWLQVTDVNGCRSLKPDTVKITVVPAVRAFAGNDTIVAVNQPLQLNATGGTNYLWSPPTGLNDANIANPVAILQNHQTYTVTAFTPEGCNGSATINIKVFKGPEIYVAGAFTPNRDGNNDILFAIPAGIKKFKYFKVFNRWGKEIFSTTEYRNGWSGQWKNVDQGSDTYIWMAEGETVDGKTLFRKGTVVLIR